ncbi:MAG TPA: HD domain-containing phosphohydrolase [Solirubrobacteraceae bacterium]|nr:HD domain-containing phosphohydrolase [Solirubrobacteraceae bacterium]
MVVERIRLVDVLAALSLTTDLASGFPFERGLRACLIADVLARALELGPADHRAAFLASLLRGIGCGHASENAALFGDDIAFERFLVTFDPSDEAVAGAQLAAFEAVVGAAAMRRFVEVAPSVGPGAVRASCEVAVALGAQLGLPASVLEGFDDAFERWDGRGLPRGRAGEQVHHIARILAVADQAAIAHAIGGVAAARAEIARRSGGQLDPFLCDAFLANADEVLAPIEAAQDLVEAVHSAEPPPVVSISPAGLERTCLALATFADLKGTHLIGHSPHVTELAVGAASLAGLDGVEELRLAALLHDVGRAGVLSSIWDRAGPLGAADRERVRLHPHWTERVLSASPALTPLAALAAAHHERLDGSGYHRAARASDLPRGARLLAAADVLAAMTEDRPYRPAVPLEHAAGLIQDEAVAGRLDPEMVAAVIAAAGGQRPRTAWPNDLTDREVEVLRLAARGLSNKEIAASLIVSPRTVQNHLAAVYDKIGRRTRAGAAVFAVEHGLT